LNQPKLAGFSTSRTSPIRKLVKCVGFQPGMNGLGFCTCAQATIDAWAVWPRLDRLRCQRTPWACMSDLRGVKSRVLGY
jgi:hypothetical protein